MNIGWDIGIKNLSYCIIDDDSKIKDWGIIDVTDNEEHKCGFITQKAKVCGKVAKKIDKNTKKMYCNMHSKKLELHDILICFECKNKAKKKNKEDILPPITVTNNYIDIYPLTKQDVKLDILNFKY